MSKLYPEYLLLFSHSFMSDSLWLFVTPACLDCSMPGFSVLYHLPEFAQTHVHWTNDAIQPSHPLSPRSPSGLNLSQHQGLFQRVDSALSGQIIGASASVLPMNIQGWFPLGLTGLISLLFKGLSRVFSIYYSI